MDARNKPSRGSSRRNNLAFFRPSFRRPPRPAHGGRAREPSMTRASSLPFRATGPTTSGTWHYPVLLRRASSCRLRAAACMAPRIVQVIPSSPT